MATKKSKQKRQAKLTKNNLEPQKRKEKQKYARNAKTIRVPKSKTQTVREQKRQYLRQLAQTGGYSVAKVEKLLPEHTLRLIRGDALPQQSFQLTGQTIHEYRKAIGEIKVKGKRDDKLRDDIIAHGREQILRKRINAHITVYGIKDGKEREEPIINVEIVGILLEENAMIASACVNIHAYIDRLMLFIEANLKSLLPKIRSVTTHQLVGSGTYTSTNATAEYTYA